MIKIQNKSVVNIPLIVTTSASGDYPFDVLIRCLPES